jgi:hypothetical protein
MPRQQRSRNPRLQRSRGHTTLRIKESPGHQNFKGQINASMASLRYN